MTDAEETKPTLTEQDNSEELKRVLEDMETFKYCKTSILYEARFMTTEDKFVFDSLPLTNSQKEELLLSIYSTEDGEKS
jgi:hypothetical protein